MVPYHCARLIGVRTVRPSHGHGQQHSGLWLSIASEHRRWVLLLKGLSGLCRHATLGAMSEAEGFETTSSSPPSFSYSRGRFVQAPPAMRPASSRPVPLSSTSIAGNKPNSNERTPRHAMPTSKARTPDTGRSQPVRRRRSSPSLLLHVALPAPSATHMRLRTEVAGGVLGSALHWCSCTV